MINNLLGLNYETYLSGAYFHEFSATASFFISSAKERRAICEQIVDLTLPKKIQAELVIKKKDAKKVVDIELAQLTKAQDRIGHLTDNLEGLSNQESEYLNELSQKIKNYKKLRDNFEETQSKTLIDLSAQKDRVRAEIANLGNLRADVDRIKSLRGTINTLSSAQAAEGICGECGGPKDHTKNKELQNIIFSYNLQKLAVEHTLWQGSQLSLKIKSLEQASLTEAARKNTYHGLLTELKTEKNPYEEQIENNTTGLAKVIAEETLRSDRLLIAKQVLADLELLSEVTDTLRSRTIINTINQVQDNTNKLLSTHFDAELTVNFEVVDADKLEVSIYKDSNICVYTQLSKGQRQLLKLCFGLSIMKAVSNNNSVKFNSIFLDESLDGLDDNLKVKSYTLLQTLALEYDSVFVVEHNESLKAMFPKRFIVTNTNGESTIEES